MAVPVTNRSGGKRKYDDTGGSAPAPACPMAGRMAVPLACGLMTALQDKLKNELRPPAQASLKQLRDADAEEAAKLMNDFQTALGRVRARCTQVFAYWDELPWALVMVMRPFVEQFSSDAEAGHLEMLSVVVAVSLGIVICISSVLCVPCRQINPGLDQHSCKSRENLEALDSLDHPS